jgi:hypothetical protein
MVDAQRKTYRASVPVRFDHLLKQRLCPPNEPKGAKANGVSPHKWEARHQRFTKPRRPEVARLLPSRVVITNSVCQYKTLRGNMSIVLSRTKMGSAHWKRCLPAAGGSIFPISDYKRWIVTTDLTKNPTIHALSR